MQAFKGEVAAKELQVKEAAQAGKVALLEGQMANKSKTIEVSIFWHSVQDSTHNLNHVHSCLKGADTLLQSLLPLLTLLFAGSPKISFKT